MGSVCSRSPEVIEFNNKNQNQNKESNLLGNKSQDKADESIKSSRYQTPTQEFIRGDKIGSGKIGSVYNGLSINTGKIVVVKELDFKRYQDKVEDYKSILNRISEQVEKFVKDNKEINLDDKNLNTYITCQQIDDQLESNNFLN